LKGVEEVHELHVWSITSDHPSLSGHVAVHPEVDRDALLVKATKFLKENFKIKHATIQLEGENFAHDEEEEYSH